MCTVLFFFFFFLARDIGAYYLEMKQQIEAKSKLSLQKHRLDT